MSKVFRVPDVKAPRFRQEGHNIIDKELIKKFKEKHPKYKKLSQTEFYSIVKKFNETLWENVIDGRDGVDLPEGIGSLFIGTCKRPKSANIDYAKSRKYGVSVSNTNWETDGKLAKIFYTSYASKYKFEFRECWSFVACRNFKRSVAKTYPENWTIYMQVDPVKKLRNFYKSSEIRKVNEKKLNRKLVNYNEFEI
jgi:hypothetical protein